MSGVSSAPLSDAQADQVLSEVRGRLQLVLTSPTHIQPGQPVTASLIPTTQEIDVSELANGVLNLAWVGKDVLFTSKDPVDVPNQGDLEGDELAKTKVALVSGQPFPPPAPVVGGGPVANPPGVLGQLFGTLALPQLKIGLRVRWVVRDQAGLDLKEGQDFVAAQGLNSPTVSLVFPPIFREFRLDTLTDPGGSVICLSVEGTLSLGAKNLPFAIGPVPVLLLPLIIPTVVVLFSEPNFGLTHDSSVLIIVPKHSPFASAEPLFKTLKKIEAAVSALRGIGGMASFFLGLDELIGTVPDHPRIRFAAADGIPRLGKIKIKRRPWYHLLGEDPNWDDRAFSLIVFGLPGTKVQFFNDVDFKMGTGQGNFDIALFNTLPDLDFFVAVRTLDTTDDKEPETFPPSFSAKNRVPRFEKDTGGDGVWHTDMSSVRFHQDWLNVVDAEIKNPLQPPPLTCRQRPVPTPRPSRTPT